MLNEEAFCLVGLLKVGKSLKRVADLLPPDRRETVLRLAAEYSQLPSQDLRKKLVAMRESGLLSVRTRLTAEFGNGWRGLPPLVQCWLGQALAHTHGNQDHQE